MDDNNPGIVGVVGFSLPANPATTFLVASCSIVGFDTMIGAAQSGSLPCFPFIMLAK